MSVAGNFLWHRVITLFIGIYHRCHDIVLSTEQTTVAVWYEREQMAP
jgi:hypothetical protein